MNQLPNPLGLSGGTDWHIWVGEDERAVQGCSAYRRRVCLGKVDGFVVLICQCA
jgi:hypothetical protein